MPIARLAERYSRVWIITISLIVWSGFTAACGMATSFVQLLALRVGVGIGEAGCSPPAHSLISDYFEPKRRATALAIYAFGIPLGAMIGAAFGGWLAKSFGWRVAFMSVGAPGLILALAFILVVKEPRRGLSDPARKGGGPGHRFFNPAASESPLDMVGTQGPGRRRGPFSSARWPVLNIILGLTITSFAGYGGGAFAGPYFIRAFGLDYATAGLILGLGVGLSGGLGTLAGGFISDWASQHGARWYALTPAIGIALAAPIYILAYRQGDWRDRGRVADDPGRYSSTPTWDRASPWCRTWSRPASERRPRPCSCCSSTSSHWGEDPCFTGWIIDQFARFNLNHPHAPSHSAGTGRRVRFRRGRPRTSRASCPGGVAPPGAGAAMGARCKVALVAATREGMIVTMSFLVWGAFHYLLAVNRPGQTAWRRRRRAQGERGLTSSAGR